MRIFQLPTTEHLAWYFGALAFVAVINLAVRALLQVSFKIRLPITPFTRAFWVYAAVQTVALFVDDRTRILINLGYIAWAIWGDKIPWDGWKKKLAAKLSSLTEVAKASLQRQTNEAFS
jgi:hypothetical protein